MHQTKLTLILVITMQIFDNFLSQEQFAWLKTNLESENFMWCFNRDLSEQFNLNLHQHLIFNSNKDYFNDSINLIKPINSFLKYYQLRYSVVYSILYNKERKIGRLYNQPHHKAILCFYSTDGYFKVNNEEVSMVQNRLLIFKNDSYSITTCANNKRNLLLVNHYALSHELKYNL